MERARIGEAVQRCVAAVLGEAVFYLRDPVDGFNAGAGLPALHAGDATIRHAMGLSMADAAARLGALDYRAVGLGDFGKPDGFLDRQVPRWLSELESYSAFENYPGPDIGDVAGVGQQVVFPVVVRLPVELPGGLLLLKIERHGGESGCQPGILCGRRPDGKPPVDRPHLPACKPRGDSVA
jgi:hypothetical protein